MSAAEASLFCTSGQGFQSISAQMSTFQDQFAQAVASGAVSYALAEAAAANPLQAVLDLINAPTVALLQA